MLKNLLNRLTPILAALVVALAIIQLHSCGKQENLAQANLALQDSLHKSHDKYGHLVTSTAVVQLENKTFRKEITVKDSTIKELQKIAQKYKKDLYEATAITIETKEHGTAGDIKSTPHDTVTKNNLIYVYPEYSKTVTKPWGFTMSVKMNKEQMDYDIQMINRMQFITRYHRKRLLAVKEPIIDVVTYNPNTGVEELKTYIPKQPRRYTGLKIACAILGGFIGGKLIH